MVNLTHYSACVPPPPPPPSINCTVTGALTADCDGTVFGIDTLAPSSDPCAPRHPSHHHTYARLLTYVNVDGSVLLVQVAEGGLPQETTVASGTCTLPGAGFTVRQRNACIHRDAWQAALLLPSGSCTPLAQLPSLAPSQWTLSPVTPPILDVAMSYGQLCGR